MICFLIFLVCLRFFLGRRRWKGYKNGKNIFQCIIKNRDFFTLTFCFLFVIRHFYTPTHQNFSVLWCSFKVWTWIEESQLEASLNYFCSYLEMYSSHSIDGNRVLLPLPKFLEHVKIFGYDFKVCFHTVYQ